MAEISDFNKALKEEILNWPELGELIDQRAEQRFREMKVEQKLTYEDIAAEWQISLTTAKTLTDEQLSKMGLFKAKVGAWVRFRRIATVDASRELFRKIKKGKL